MDKFKKIKFKNPKKYLSLILGLALLVVSSFSPLHVYAVYQVTVNLNISDVGGQY